MTVIVPGDPIEAMLAVKAAVEHQGPCYLRLGKGKEPIIHQQTPEFQIGKAIKVMDGKDVTLISTGDVLSNVVKAAEQLADNGIKAQVFSMHTVKPIDTSAVLSAGQETAVIITIEEHNIIGGLGSAVAEVLAESGISGVVFKRLGINDSFSTKVGSQEYLRKDYLLSVEGIVNTVKSTIRRKTCYNVVK